MMFGPIAFDRRAVIVKMLDRHLLRDVYQAPIVIAVIVGQPEVIDLLHARDLQHLQDAIQIALAGVTGIHQQRLSGRRNEQRRLAALGVDVIDVEGLARWRLGGRPNRHRTHG